MTNRYGWTRRQFERHISKYQWAKWLCHRQSSPAFCSHSKKWWAERLKHAVWSNIVVLHFVELIPFDCRNDKPMQWQMPSAMAIASKFPDDMMQQMVRPVCLVWCPYGKCISNPINQGSMSFSFTVLRLKIAQCYYTAGYWTMALDRNCTKNIYCVFLLKSTELLQSTRLSSFGSVSSSFLFSYKSM